MKSDRVADIPVRHRFVDYVCTMSFSEEYDSFTLVRARFADPRRSGRPKNQTQLYLRILKEPTLRANLLEALAPGGAGQIAELREKAIQERGNSYGLNVGLAVFALAGYALYLATHWLTQYLGHDGARMATYIPAFFAFLIVFPVQRFVARWYARRYCAQHSHTLKTFEDARGRAGTSCRRCGFISISPPRNDDA